MSKKKDHESKELSEQEKVTRRVDAMLDPKLPDPPAAKPGTAPPLDIFKDAPTAPEIPAPGKLSHKEPSRHTVPAPIVADPKEPPKDPVSKKNPLDDRATDEAVSDIAAKEGNTLLALQDAIGDKATHIAGNLAEEDRQKARRRRWAWLIFFVVFIVIVLLALPLNPYTCKWPVGVRLRVTTDIVPSVCK